MPESKELIANEKVLSEVKSMVNNVIYSRTQLINKLIDGGGKDLNTDCGWPDEISKTDYAAMYDREGIAARVNDVWPEESWATAPEIYETEDPDQETEFEVAWKKMDKKCHLLSMLGRADILSGVGKFGVILLGLNDGKDLSLPVDGVPENGDITKGKRGITRELIYVRAFQESAVSITNVEKNPNSSRFGLPNMYSITFNDTETSFSSMVHWHRIIHLADNREMSEIMGTPRMKKSYNRLLDIRKILGGSGEMFWRGGFPGFAFETKEGDSEIELDKESIKTELQNYMTGLQRYMALEGLSVKSLAPQVADPKNHLEVHLSSIAITLGVPKRILFGSEQAELASTQDAKTWNRRLKKRQNGYLTPYVIRPFIDRLILIGVLPTVEEYFVKWSDINIQTEKEKAEVAKAWAEALSKFVGGDVDSVIPIEEFLSILGNLPQEQVLQISEKIKNTIMEEEELTPHDETLHSKQIKPDPVEDKTDEEVI
jgi:hypothetical protein